MKWVSKILQMPLVVCGYLVLLPLAQAQTIELNAEQQGAINIQTTAVATQTTFPSQWFLGHLDVLNQAELTLSTPLTGQIQKIYKHSGHVSANEALIEMRSPQITQLQSALLSTLAKLSVAQKDTKRLKRLSQNGSASAQDYQAAQAEAISLEATQAEIEQSLLNYGFEKNALQQLKKTNQLQSPRVIIRSLVDAEIHDVMVMTGQNLDEYQPLMTLLNHDNLMIKVAVPVDHASTLKIGDSALVQIGKQSLTATISFIPHHLDALTQTQQIQLQFQASIESMNLNLNQRVKVQFQHAHSQTLYQAPLNSLTQEDGQDFVFAQIAEGKYQTVNVNVVATEKNVVYFHPQENTSVQTVVVQGTSALKLALGAQEE